jgi:N-acetylmuramoyl-L-alanine amidase
METFSRASLLRRIGGVLFLSSLQPLIADKVRVARVRLADISRQYAMKMGLTGDQIVLKGQYTEVKIEQRGRRAWINGVMFWLHKPSRASAGHWTIEEVDYLRGLDPVLRSYRSLVGMQPKRIVIDPGHGGKDTGAIGAGELYEKTVVLDISKRIKAGLEQFGFKVYLTRSGDQYLTLTERAAFAKKVKADLFLSIHADGATSAAAHGVQTFISTCSGYESSNSNGKGGNLATTLNNTYDRANAALGYAIQSNLLHMSQRSDRGVRRARFSVIKNAPAPAALIECGFLTNREEGRLLGSTAYRKAVAIGIINGVRAYATLADRARA